MLVIDIEDLAQPFAVLHDRAGAQWNPGPDHIHVVVLVRVPRAGHEHPATGTRFARMLFQQFTFLHLTERGVQVVQVPLFRVLPLALGHRLPAVVQHH